MTPLIHAILRDNITIAKRLIEDGADVNEGANRNISTALQAATTRGNLEMVKLLVEKGADVNREGGHHGNALQAAAIGAGGNHEIVKFLVENGANVNQQGGFFGNTLQAAAAWEHLEIVEFLVENGANVNEQGGYYRSAMQAAVARKDLRIVELLVNRGADVSFQNTFQLTALHYAVQYSAVEIVKFLLGKNASPDAKDDMGTTPFDIAVEARDKEIIQLLLSRMESPPLLSANRWRDVLHLEHAEPLSFTFESHLSIESIKSTWVTEMVPIKNYMPDNKAPHMLSFRLQFNNDQEIHDRLGSMSSIPKEPVHIVINDAMLENISPSSIFTCRWWRRYLEGPMARDWSLVTSPLPSPDLCRQLGPGNFFVESWFTISCFTITDTTKWPSQQVLESKTYDHLKRVEGFFWVTALPPNSDFNHDISIEEFLRPVCSVTTCNDTPVKSIRSIHDLLMPLIEKLDRIFEENILQASRELSDARLEVLRSGGCNESLLHRLLSDATVIEYMAENHNHIVRSLTKLVSYVVSMQNGPWRLSSDKSSEVRKRGIKRLELHREGLRELLERSQTIIQLEFNLASILEARRSTSTNRSLKRLTWVTFVFLPLLFVASLFGMNVDILSDDPSWWWYFPIAGGFILLTFGVWIFFKRFNTLEGRLERYFAWLVGDEIEVADTTQPGGRRQERRGSEETIDFKNFAMPSTHLYHGLRRSPIDSMDSE